MTANIIPLNVKMMCGLTTNKFFTEVKTQSKSIMLKHQGNIEAWQLPSVDKLDCLPKKINREVKWSLGKVVQTSFHTQEYIITYALQMRANQPHCCNNIENSFC